jgi:hypothetical protein
VCQPHSQSDLCHTHLSAHPLLPLLYKSQLRLVLSLIMFSSTNLDPTKSAEEEFEMDFSNTSVQHQHPTISKSESRCTCCINSTNAFRLVFDIGTLTLSALLVSQVGITNETTRFILEVELLIYMLFQFWRCVSSFSVVISASTIAKPPNNVRVILYKALVLLS